MKLSDIDFQYNVEYDHHGGYDCSSYGCDEEGICRCYTISEPYITSCNYMTIAESIYSSLFGDVRKNKLANLLYGGNQVDIYSINRLLKIYGANDLFDFNYQGDYYGDIMESISLNSENLENDIRKVVGMGNITDKLNFLLIKEYGKLLDTSQETNYEIITIKRDEIDETNLNKKHIQLVTEKDISFYNVSDYGDMPRGIVKKTQVGYHIIDGYHRIFKIKNKSQKFKVFLQK